MRDDPAARRHVPILLTVLASCLHRVSSPLPSCPSRSPRRRVRSLFGVPPTRCFARAFDRIRCERSLSAPLERLPCSPARLHASSVLPGCTTLRSRKSGPQPRSPAHLNAVLPGPLGGGRTLHPCGQGGSRARAAAPERRGALRWRYGRVDHFGGGCEVARGRCNGRLCACSSVRQTLAPLSPIHGLGACTWKQNQN